MAFIKQSNCNQHNPQFVIIWYHLFGLIWNVINFGFKLLLAIVEIVFVGFVDGFRNWLTQRPTEMSQFSGGKYINGFDIQMMWH